MMDAPAAVARCGSTWAREGTAGGPFGAAPRASSLLGRAIELQPSPFQKVHRGQVADLLREREETIAAVHLLISGEVKGRIVVLAPEADARALLHMFMGLPLPEFKPIGAMERQALGEVGRLCGALLLRALAEAAGLRCRISPPAVMIGQASGATAGPVDGLESPIDSALAARIAFSDGQLRRDALLLLIPEAPSLDTLWEVLVLKCYS